MFDRCLKPDGAMIPARQLGLQRTANVQCQDMETAERRNAESVNEASLTQDEFDNITSLKFDFFHHHKEF